MGQSARDGVEIRDFPGLATDVDPNDLQPGAAQEQVNVASGREATLTTRRGLRRVSFEEE